MGVVRTPMKHLVSLGRIPVPRVLTTPVSSIRDLTKVMMREMPNRYKDNVVQFNPPSAWNNDRYRGRGEVVTIKNVVEARIPRETRFDEDFSVLGFKNVDEHTDWWPAVKVKGQWYRSFFLHWVLTGKFELKVGKEVATFKKGDVFAMNPNVKHFVKTPLTCVTMCKTIRAVDVELFRVANGLKGVCHENVHFGCRDHRRTDVPRRV